MPPCPQSTICSTPDLGIKLPKYDVGGLQVREVTDNYTVIAVHPISLQWEHFDSEPIWPM